VTNVLLKYLNLDRRFRLTGVVMLAAGIISIVQLSLQAGYVIMDDKIKIVVVDDHPLFRDGVVYTLKTESDFEVVGQGTTADEAVCLAGDLLPNSSCWISALPGKAVLRRRRTIVTACPATKLSCSPLPPKKMT